MAVTTIRAKGADNVERDIPITPAGRAVAAESKPVTLSTEDKAALDALGGALPAAGKQTPIEKLTGGATNIVAANPNRYIVDFTNNHLTVAVRVKEGAAATSTSGYRLQPGGSYISLTQDYISVCPESGNADCFGYEVVR
jgi:hypothetical protein